MLCTLQGCEEPVSQELRSKVLQRILENTWEEFFFGRIRLRNGCKVFCDHRIVCLFQWVCCCSSDGVHIAVGTNEGAVYVLEDSLKVR